MTKQPMNYEIIREERRHEKEELENSQTLLVVVATCLSVHLGKRSLSKIITKSGERYALLSV